MRRGKKHDYLGMTLDFSKSGAFIVDMEEYLKETIKDLSEDMNGTATTPTADHVFKVRDNSPKLNEERAEMFHRVVAQLLFVTRRGQPDLQTVVSFLTKRFQALNEDNQIHLKNNVPMSYPRSQLPRSEPLVH